MLIYGLYATGSPYKKLGSSPVYSLKGEKKSYLNLNLNSDLAENLFISQNSSNN